MFDLECEKRCMLEVDFTHRNHQASKHLFPTSGGTLFESSENVSVNRPPPGDSLGNTVDGWPSSWGM